MAEFRSAERRRTWLALAFYSALDLALCVALARVFDKDDFLLATFVLFFGLQALGICLAIKGFVWAIIGAKVFDTDDAVIKLEQHFRSKGFPAPNAWETSVGDYFARLRDDESLPLNARLSAAAEHGAFDAATGGGLLKSVVLSSRYEKAIKRLAG